MLALMVATFLLPACPALICADSARPSLGFVQARATVRESTLVIQIRRQRAARSRRRRGHPHRLRSLKVIALFAAAVVVARDRRVRPGCCTVMLHAVFSGCSLLTFPWGFTTPRCGVSSVSEAGPGVAGQRPRDRPTVVQTLSESCATCASEESRGAPRTS